MPQNIGYSDKYAAFSFLKMVVEESGVEEKLEEVKDKLKTFSRTYFQIGQNWQSIGERLAAPFQAAAKVFADFDDQMRRVAAVTGSSTANLQKMTDVAKQLGASTRYSASQVAGGMGALGMMGFSSKEINEAISKVMDLAPVTGTELAEAASIAANQLRVFRMDASQMVNVADILAATANGSAQTLADLG
ncbi:MAG: phage tail tape measure protein [Lentisphaeria bacterium]|nr:phage tail tape measure protein [Lentisphaeria bacterium]